MNIKTVLIVIAGLVLIWSSFLWFLIVKADYVRKDPCTVCSERMGDDVICRAGESTRIYYPNGTITDDIAKGKYARDIYVPFNTTELNITVK